MGHLREPLLLGAVTVAVAAMIGMPVDDFHYRLCVRSEDHRAAALAALDQGRLLLACQSRLIPGLLSAFLAP